MLGLLVLIIGLCIVGPVIAWIIRVGFTIWRILGIISCIVAIIILFALMTI